MRHETGCFEFIATGGYYHSLPGDALRQFIEEGDYQPNHSCTLRYLFLSRSS